jgi:hypothetical protein
MLASMIIKVPEDMTSEWLSSALRRDGLELVSSAAIGTGQMSQNHRVTFREEKGSEETVVVKLASPDENSRGTGVGMGAYECEVRFYQQTADRAGDAVPVCHFADYDPGEGWFTIVLSDIEGAEQGDQIRGCTPAEAGLVMDTLARFHAPYLGDLEMAVADWLNKPYPLNQALHEALLPSFLERYADRIDPEHAEVAKRFVASHDAWFEDARPPLGLVHGDYRLDNLLFAAGRVTVVDFQTMGWAPPLRDVAYFLGTGLSIDDRREHEEALVRRYLDGLESLGIESLDWETCWQEYRRQVFLALLMCTMPAMVVVRTERGDDMFMATFARVCQQIIDLDSLSLLPEAGSDVAAALVPKPEDEGRHTPGSDALWNESWYADGVSADGSLGVYLRLGRMPNADRALYTAYVCGPDRPTVMLVDGKAPLPDQADDMQVIETERYSASQSIDEPLRSFSMRVRGMAESFDDPAAILVEGASGEAVELELELTWVTDGQPYRWRIGERYEVPCRVSGTVRVGNEVIQFSGPGQRDHSWGSRDWWGADWMWSAFHFEDGTHTHLVTTPTLPGRGIGYVQKGDEVTEMAEAESDHVVRDDGLVASDRLTMTAAGLEIEVEPIAFGPIRLVAGDGRVSHFVRAMSRVSDGSGRSGTGWIEWNMNQPS